MGVAQSTLCLKIPQMGQPSCLCGEECFLAHVCWFTQHSGNSVIAVYSALTRRWIWNYLIHWGLSLACLHISSGLILNLSEGGGGEAVG